MKRRYFFKSICFTVVSALGAVFNTGWASQKKAVHVEELSISDAAEKQQGRPHPGDSGGTCQAGKQYHPNCKPEKYACREGGYRVP